MMKNGFTLIETIVSIFILIILSGICLTLYKFKNNLEVDMKDTAYVYEVQNLLSYGKAVCKEKNNYGKITVNGKINEIKFEEGWDGIEKKIVLPSELKFISNNINLVITPEGKIEKGNTIIILDKFKKKHFITIRVGVDSISTEDVEDI
ncbi:type II secretion system protein [Clostridium saccharobutylicum]|uniref:Prepilin-type N-terminal cleavage/methylation domain-containing protein n=1 Tax=Clostridium saccharobutylicum DSM 13864 TaxID=1345695 RepID=U5MT16_CLOSA|nr:type II secretion system protein [Clostridium saccharobutylicum]AGX43678.1 hypothetical protein CLSA_c27070 [Clostridium saccharobutylicum DSM 13864]AQR90976.1 hypothetical protein CLOSC_26970 [Clostridium saccharobutylicum]AQS00880.1 hypothetical protein CSACC_27040 [Clostridium saccharobutylicum]AQS10536.1 hypothetical protein CLOBY_26810 [Clostridium saccharobutylicum]AQS14863.1 hypothetical protein CLOSACC_27040 [Clostridium saccharobutylicum]